MRAFFVFIRRNEAANIKKKYIRSVVIIAVAVLLLGTMLLQIEIEPADNSAVPKAEGNYVALEKQPEKTDVSTKTPALTGEETSEPDDILPSGSHEAAAEIEESVAPGEAAPAEKESDEFSAESITESAPAENKENSSDEEVTDKPPTCTVEVRCDTVVDTSKLENEAVIPYIPADGVILPTTVVEFIPGETAFDVLKRATRANDIQLEFRGDPVYSGGINIEGIGYLYDFDAGALSGWMYKVNEQFPNHGTNSYYVEDGDVLVWVYTCDLGVDVGDNSVWW